MKKIFMKMGAMALVVSLCFQGMGITSSLLFAQQNTSTLSNQMSSEKEEVKVHTLSGKQDRSVINFNEDWKFFLGDAKAAAPAFDDSKWENISIPHDYSISQKFSTGIDAESGYLAGGIGWYRKRFNVDAALKGKEIRLDFDGVYMNASVYVNGVEIGKHHYGYTPFSFDISDALSYGAENVIAVKVNHQTPSSRWYSGSGIYRDVHISIMNKVHVGLYGTFVSSPNLEQQKNGDVTTNIKTTVMNEGTSAANVIITHNIYEKGSTTKVATVTTNAKSIAAGQEAIIEANASVNKPKLWDVKNPNLYTVRSEVKVNNQVVDTYDTEFGYRYFSMDKDRGAFLNGKAIKLKGVCMHHDQGALGASAYRDAIARQVDILKEMGCNSIRVTHNPAASLLIEICNEKGMLVIDEMFDGWMHQKNNNTNDFSVWFNREIEANNQILGQKANMTWAEFDLKAAMKRGQNSPAIIMWSLGNEIQEGTGGKTGFPAVARQLIAWAKEVDTTRMLTIGSNAVKNIAEEHIDIANQLTNVGGASGTNYSNGNSYTDLHRRYPNWKLYGSETASSVNSRGVYYTRGKDDVNRQLTSYDEYSVSWGARASEAWYDVITRDYVAGEYVWTGFDYIGEPTPWNGTYPGEQNTSQFDKNPKNSFFGIVDTAGLVKDSYYFYQSQWNDDVTTLHILPVWNRDSVQINNGKVKVVVYSDAPQVELKLNGQSLGIQKFVKKTTGQGYTYQHVEGKNNHEGLYMTWDVDYADGTLEAIAYDEHGNKLTGKTSGRNVVKTANAANKLVASVNRETMDANGYDLAYVSVDICDQAGNLVPNANHRVTFTVQGEGEVVGVDNGSAPDHDPYVANNKRAHAGKVVAIVRSTKKGGTFTVTAQAAGLQPASVQVQSIAENKPSDQKEITSFTMAKHYYVQANTSLTLPKTITTNYSDGSVVEENVAWDAYDASLLQQSNSFTVNGTVCGMRVSVRVNVIERIGGILNYSTTTSVGKEATLPQRRPLVLVDGSVKADTTFAVEWEQIDPSRYNNAGTFVVNGTANVFGKTYPVTASIRVQATRYELGNNVAGSAAGLSQDIVENLQSDSLAAIKDGSKQIVDVTSGPNTSIWTNYDNSQANDPTAEITFRYDTTFALGQVKVYFTRDSWSARYPKANTTKIYVSDTGSADSWKEVVAKETIADYGTSGRVKEYTYSFDQPYGATFVKLAITNNDEHVGDHKACTGIVEVELLKADQQPFTQNTSAQLSSLTVNNTALTSTQLEKSSYATMAKEINVTNYATKDNAALTVLPLYNDQIKLIMESEDHNTLNTFTVYANRQNPIDPNNDKNDISLTNKMLSVCDAHGNHPKGNMIDKQNNTFWHTDWGTDKGQNVANRYIEVTFDQLMEINGLRYLSRPASSGQNGNVTTYRVEYKTNATDSEWQVAQVLDGETYVNEATWPATSGTWRGATIQPIRAKVVRLVGVHTFGDSGNDKFMSCAEFAVVGKKAVILNTQALQALINEAKTITCTPDTQTKLNEAIKVAQQTLTTAQTQAAIDEGIDNLRRAIYQATRLYKVTIQVNGVENKNLSFSAVYNSVKSTINAPKVDANKRPFVGWYKKNDNNYEYLVTKNNELPIAASGDVTYDAVYGEVQPDVTTPKVLCTNAFATYDSVSKKYDAKFVGKVLGLPKDAKLTEIGMYWGVGVHNALVDEHQNPLPGTYTTTVNKVNMYGQYSITVTGVPAGNTLTGQLFVKYQVGNGDVLTIVCDELKVMEI